LLRIREQREIINIPQVSLASEGILDEMIKRTQVEVGEELTRQVAYRQSPATRNRRQEVVTGEVVTDEFLVIAAVDDWEQTTRKPTLLLRLSGLL
jgi:hypothetical protein